MVRTRGGSHLRPRVRFSTPEREEQAPFPASVPAPVPAPVPEAVLEEPQGFRRYQTRMGPRAPSLVPQRRSRRARPSKRARTSGPGKSSSAVTCYISCRGNIIALVIACLQDQEAVIRRAPYSGERSASLERLPWGVILRRPGTDG